MCSRLRENILRGERMRGGPPGRSSSLFSPEALSARRFRPDGWTVRPASHPQAGGRGRPRQPKTMKEYTWQCLGRFQPRAGRSRGVLAPVTTLPRAHGIVERVPCDLKEPGFDPLGIPQRWQVPHDAQEHLLDHIVGLNAWRQAASHERTQAAPSSVENRKCIPAHTRASWTSPATSLNRAYCRVVPVIMYPVQTPPRRCRRNT